MDTELRVCVRERERERGGERRREERIDGIWE